MNLQIVSNTSGIIVWSTWGGCQQRPSQDTSRSDSLLTNASNISQQFSSMIIIIAMVQSPQPV